MKTIYTASLFCLLFSLSFAQGPGQPYFSETADGAINVSPFQYHSLRWQNPENTDYNEVYIDFDSVKVANMDPGSLYISGNPSTVFDSIRINQQLYYPARYFWCVVEYNSDGYTQGDIWYFSTNAGWIDYLQSDDFSFGLGKWGFNDTTGCGWQSGDKVNYTLPDPSTGNVLTSDASLCGSPVSGTAYFQEAEDIEYMFQVNLELNSDWYTSNENDYASIQISTNGGFTWSTKWAKTGISDRNKHLDLFLFTNYNPDTIYTLRVRFLTQQNGTDSWWAIDNVAITATDGILTHSHPYITHVDIIYGSQSKTVIKWGQPLPVPVELIQRKEGIPLSNNPYETIDVVQTSYSNIYIDSTVNDSSVYSYRIGNPEWDNWVVYSNDATAYVFPPVPVELVSFTGSVIDANVVLNWVTATEINNKGFEIERKESADSREETEWENIGFVNGNGTTSKPNSYSFTDKNLLPGRYQYRLKQIDFDGSFEYSNLVDITLNSPGEFSLAQNYPNPFNPVTNLSFVIGQSSFVSLKVYDMLGNEVKTLVNEVKPSGSYMVKFDGSNLSSGIYFYQITAGSFKASKKLILLK